MEILLKYPSHSVVLWARFICPIRFPKEQLIKNQPESQEIEDSGSGVRRRRADTTHPINLDTHTWRKFTRAQREEIIGHVASQAASSSSGQPIDPIPVTPMVSVFAISDTFPVVSTVGGVHAKMHSRQHKQPSNNEETSDAVTCQNMKPAECVIGTTIKPAIKKTDYVKRNIVEFCCGENSPRLAKAKTNEMVVQPPDLHLRMT